MATTVGIPVRPDGRWALDYLAGLTAGQWEEWIGNRLRGRDRAVGYRPEEYPEGASHIFKRILDMAQDEAPSELPERLAEGSAGFLKGLQPDNEEYWVLYHAMDLVGTCCRREGAGRSAGTRLKEWIENEALLKPEKWQPDGPARSVALHQAALTALALLQRRGQTARMGVFKRWLAVFERSGYPEDCKFAFMGPAFMGISLASENVPIKELKDLLRLEGQAEAQQRPVYISYAVLSLFEGQPVRPAIKVRQELAAAKEITSKEWEALMAHTVGSPHAIPTRDWVTLSEAGTASAKRTQPSARPRRDRASGPEEALDLTSESRSEAGSAWKAEPALVPG